MANPLEKRVIERGFKPRWYWHMKSAGESASINYKYTWPQDNAVEVKVFLPILEDAYLKDAIFNCQKTFVIYFVYFYAKIYIVIMSYSSTYPPKYPHTRGLQTQNSSNFYLRPACGFLLRRTSLFQFDGERRWIDISHQRTT